MTTTVDSDAEALQALLDAFSRISITLDFVAENVHILLTEASFHELHFNPNGQLTGVTVRTGDDAEDIPADDYRLVPARSAAEMLPVHIDALNAAYRDADIKLGALPAHLLDKLAAISGRPEWRAVVILDCLDRVLIWPGKVESPKRIPTHPRDILRNVQTHPPFDEWLRIRHHLSQYQQEIMSLRHELGLGNLAATHSLDFRAVNWFGVNYSFTPNQAACVAVLWASWEQGAPDVGDDTLVSAIDHDAPPRSLRDVFREHPAWGTMIVPGGSKGSHRLAGAAERTKYVG